MTFPFDDNDERSPHVNSSLVFKMLSGIGYGTKVPSFVSGYIDGQPINTSIRVRSSEKIVSSTNSEFEEQ